MTEENWKNRVQDRIIIR